MKPIAAIPLFVLFIGLAFAQPPRREEEDTKAPKKPAAPIDIESFPNPKAKAKAPEKASPDGPGVAPGRGVLVVGVRKLPEKLSPSQARTDAERWALDLLFEGLLAPIGTEGGTVFESQLALGPPRIEPQGRSFTLDPEAKWHDGQPVVANDAIATLARLRPSALGEPFSDSPRRLRLTAKSLHPDPASLCTFYITPAHHPDGDAFAAAPVGSGPFTYGGVVTEGGRRYAVFPANPEYSKRAGRANRPIVREVRFLEGADSISDFRRGLVDVVLVERTAALLSTAPAAGETVARLESGLGLDARVVTRPSRRIAYLSINPLKQALGGDAGRGVRRAIALGIDREAILNSQYRIEGQKPHAALTGPFPAGSWCCDPEAVPLDDATLAAAELKATVTDRLQLIYPSDDPLAGPACEAIRDQLQNLVPLETMGLDPVAFRKALAEQSYGLAYRTHDFRDEWFDPQPLFADNLGGAGGGATRIDAALVRAATHAEFGSLRNARRRLHVEFREVMPFVPLWSFDLHVVLRRSVTTHPIADRLDPLAPLRHAQEWRVER